MSIDSIKAAQAYLQAQGAISTQAQKVSQSNVDAGTPASFAQALNTALEQTSSDLTAADSAAQSVASGDANLVDVVTSISAAEVSLETAIAVRNRMIEAYQEIMRMPI